MRYYMSGLLLLVCFAVGWGLGRTKVPPPDVNLEIQELSIDVGDFNTPINPDEEPWSDISPGLRVDPVRCS